MQPKTRPKNQSAIDPGNITKPHKVVCLALGQAQVLDITGPLEVFSRTERLMRDTGLTNKVAYTTKIAGLTAGPVTMSSDLQLYAEYSLFDDFEVDTLVIAGGIGIDEHLDNPLLIDRICQLAKRTERLVSICNGTFLLAATGLLDDRQATTHWNHSQDFKSKYPRVDLQVDQIYCHDHPYYSSGGVTAGIDLALSLVQDDHGQKVALEVAKQLVLYLKRPGGQNQYSSILTSQVAETSALHEVVNWISDHYMLNLSVQDLADKAAMSLRNFSRRFNDETGYSPAKFIERVRIEQAMRLLEETNLAMEAIAEQCGISSAEQLGQVFSRVLKVSPKFYRKRFR